MNNRERELWINNDEGLYRWWKRSGLAMRAFIKMFKTEIDGVIERALQPRETR